MCVCVCVCVRPCGAGSASDVRVQGMNPVSSAVLLFVRGFVRLAVPLNCQGARE